MIALDTNVLVRYLTRDEPEEAARARSLIERGPVFVAKTVMLETEWVLRSAYRFRPAAIAASFTAFLGLPGVTVEDASAVGRALAWYAQGLDFADALHAASCAQADAFATFDRRLRRRAELAGMMPVIAP
ncbi:MAG: type II toxin-antitoxin system VapC family toxin [Geminicoccaceae bacterium]